MRYRVTGYDSSGITAMVELRRSFADAHLADKAERLEVARETSRSPKFIAC
jgi:hypothetical protein